VKQAVSQEFTHGIGRPGETTSSEVLVNKDVKYRSFQKDPGFAQRRLITPTKCDWTKTEE
jgi:hypothetical protein